MTAVAALAGGAQALAPASASAYIDGAGCTVDKWGFLVCEAPQSGDQGWPWEDGPGDNKKGSGNGGDAPSNVNGYDDGNGHQPPPPGPSPFDPAPHRSKPSRPSYGDDDWPYRKRDETDDQLNARWHRENCRRTRTVYLRVKREGISWTNRLWDLGKTTNDVLDQLADNYIEGNCFNAVGPLRD